MSGSDTPKSAGSTSEVSVPDPSKGVDYYAYLDVDQGFACEFQQPINTGSDTQSYWLNTPGLMQAGSLEISQSDIGVAYSGRFSWSAFQNNILIASHSADISPTTGDIKSSDMDTMLETPSIIGSGWAMSYGFYDSGAGWGGLTDHDQSYVYLTGDQSNWMGDLATSVGSALSAAPFTIWVLPGAHDSGMFDSTCVVAMLTAAPGHFLAALGDAIQVSVSVLEGLAQDDILRSIVDLAFTQKDNVSTMLDLGVRYFDFRPGMCYDNIVSGVYHQHNFIPGYPYSQFLEDVLNWLTGHPTEIVVVSANSQGFNSAVAKPAPSTLADMVTTAQQATNTTATILPGDKNDLGKSYAELIKGKTRLIFLNQIGAADDAVKYDSYQGNLYTTASSTEIIMALNAMDTKGQTASPQPDYTVLQLQGTATGLAGGIWQSVATLSDASSPLMSTKAAFDHQTYPWLVANVPRNLSTTQLVVLLNDFADNALARCAAEVTRLRVPVKFPLAAPVAAVSCQPGRTDIFAVAVDGEVLTSRSYNAAGWRGWRRIGTATFAPGTPIAACSDDSGAIDIFAVGANGTVYTASNHGGGWTAWSALPSTTSQNTAITFPGGAAISGVAAAPGWLDVFVLGGDGKLYTASSHDGSPWSTWSPVGGGVFSPGTAVTAVSDSAQAIDLLAVGTSGLVYGAYWSGSGPWQDWSPIGALTLDQPTPVAAVSDNPGNLDIFVVYGPGEVMSASNHGQGWGGSAWTTLPTLTDPVGPFNVPKGSALAAVSPVAQEIDVFVLDQFGTIRQSCLQGTNPLWSGWAAVMPGAVFPPGTRPAAVAPGSGVTQLFAVGTNQQMWTAWEQFSQWTGWTPIGTV